ncbi:MAG: EamA family transporter [Elainellaceae cyanobacterium]
MYLAAGTNPAVAIALANRFLNETLTLQQGIGIALGLISIVLITA